MKNLLPSAVGAGLAVGVAMLSAPTALASIDADLLALLKSSTALDTRTVLDAQSDFRIRIREIAIVVREVDISFTERIHFEHDTNVKQNDVLSDTVAVIQEEAKPVIPVRDEPKFEEPKVAVASTLPSLVQYVEPHVEYTLDDEADEPEDETLDLDSKAEEFGISNDDLVTRLNQGRTLHQIPFDLGIKSYAQTEPDGERYNDGLLTAKAEEFGIERDDLLTRLGQGRTFEQIPNDLGIGMKNPAVDETEENIAETQVEDPTDE